MSAQLRDQGPGSYRKPNAHGGREGARNELALVKLDQQRRLPHAAVSNQDCLQGPDKEASVQVQEMGKLQAQSAAGGRHLGRGAGGMWQQMQQDEEGPTQPLCLSLLVLLFAQRGISIPLSMSVINEMWPGISFQA